MRTSVFDVPHRRLNPLTREWVLASPRRASRPWQGQVETTQVENRPQYDPHCYLCPGNGRAAGTRNPIYDGTFAFDNDFPALLPAVFGKGYRSDHPLFVAMPESGICRVVCFPPRHDFTIPELEVAVVEDVIDAWTRESVDLASREFIGYVQVFENKGAMMGCSNPHPHSQIWAERQIPNEPAKELDAQAAYFNDCHRPMLSDYLAREHEQRARIVAANDHFTAVVPFWAIWPFEILLVSHRAIPRLDCLTPAEATGLAELYREVTIRYDNLLECSFPYSMGIHGAPADGQPHSEWVLHIHFYPPLLRSPTIRKYMVGYELLAMPQRDITPEMAAERLRSTPSVHHRQR